MVLRIITILVLSHLSFLGLSHEIRPASLVITEQEKTDDSGHFQYNVFWKIPHKNGLVINIAPEFDSSFVLKTIGPPAVDPSYSVFRYNLQSPAPIENTPLSIHNLENTLIDVLVTVNYRNGDYATVLLQPTKNNVKVPSRATKGSVISTYTELGIEHILLGYDHLLFVLALFMLSPNFKKLLKTITAFTVAHSLTLALTALDIIKLPSAPVEAIIALSIVYLAIEIIQKMKGVESYTSKNPWPVAFLFGLLHGLGFAGALSEIGLPKIFIPYALGFFNIGVELGQIIFILIIALVTYLLSKIVKNQKKITLITSYAIGSIAMFWFIERVYGILF